MRVLQTLLFSFFLVNGITCQTLTISAGAAFTHTRQKVRMSQSHDDFSNSANFWAFKYYHFLPAVQLSVFSEYFNYEGSTIVCV